VWPWKRRDDPPEPEPTSDKQRLERLLYRLADTIGHNADETDRFWSNKVRACADQVRAGQPSGLRKFLGLFGGMGSINDQRFSGVFGRELSEAYDLANALLREVVSEASAQRATGQPASGQRHEIVLRPWSEGHTGKGLVYEDGLVVASEDDGGGEPNIAQIKHATGHEGRVVAIVGIAPDGSCHAFRCERDESWLAARLHDHDPGLHLVDTATPGPQ
jgi:hypothetical protein